MLFLFLTLSSFTVEGVGIDGFAQLQRQAKQAAAILFVCVQLFHVVPLMVRAETYCCRSRARKPQLLVGALEKCIGYVSRVFGRVNSGDFVLMWWWRGGVQLQESEGRAVHVKQDTDNIAVDLTY